MKSNFAIGMNRLSGLVFVAAQAAMLSSTAFAGDTKPKEPTQTDKIETAVNSINKKIGEAGDKTILGELDTQTKALGTLTSAVESAGSKSVKALETVNTSINTTSAALAKAIKDSQDATVADLKAAYTAAMTDLKTKLDAAQKVISDSLVRQEQSLVATKIVIGRIDAATAAATGKLANIHDDLRIATKDIEDANKSLARLETAVANVGGEVHEVNGQVVIANKQLITLLTKADEFNAKFDAAQQLAMENEVQRSLENDEKPANLLRLVSEGGRFEIAVKVVSDNLSSMKTRYAQKSSSMTSAQSESINRFISDVEEKLVDAAAQKEQFQMNKALTSLRNAYKSLTKALGGKMSFAGYMNSNN
jgi:hypothetical protein